VVLKEVAAEEEEAVPEDGVMLLEMLVVEPEADTSRRDLVLLTRLITKETKVLIKIEDKEEVIEETEVVTAKSMRASTREMVPVEAKEEEERVVIDLQEMIRPKMNKRKKLKSPLLRRRRSLNLNMKKLFLVKISMTSLAP
jgi:hypothetical protein